MATKSLKTHAYDALNKLDPEMSRSELFKHVCNYFSGSDVNELVAFIYEEHDRSYPVFGERSED